MTILREGMCIRRWHSGDRRGYDDGIIQYVHGNGALDVKLLSNGQIVGWSSNYNHLDLPHASALVNTWWYHEKDPSVKYVVEGWATLQASGELDRSPMVVYRSMADDKQWVRPIGEFTDGRFKLTTPPPRVPCTRPDPQGCYRVRCQLGNRCADLPPLPVHPSWCCQRCGEPIGWVRRFLLPFLHRCD